MEPLNKYTGSLEELLTEIRGRLAKQSWRYHWNEAPIMNMSKKGYEFIIGWKSWYDPYTESCFTETIEQYEARRLQEKEDYSQRKSFFDMLRIKGESEIQTKRLDSNEIPF